MGGSLTLRRLLTTEVIQVVFWLASIGIVIASIGAIAGDEPLAGILLLVFGLLYLRVLCEVFIVLFRMHDTAVDQGRHGRDRRRRDDTCSGACARGADGGRRGGAAPDGGLVRRLRVFRLQALLGRHGVGETRRRDAARGVAQRMTRWWSITPAPTWLITTTRCSPPERPVMCSSSTTYSPTRVRWTTSQ
jgi:hypothetical protein